MKKILTLMFMVFGLTLANVNAAFVDVPSDYLYKTAIDYVQAEGIVNGYSDGTFKPNDTISRGEFTKIIINALYTQEQINACLGNNFVANADEGAISFGNVFPDIEGGSQNNLNGEYTGGVFTKYICVAKVRNVVSGYSDGNFKKDDNISVGQASKIIANAFGLTSNPVVTDENHKFKPYVEALIDRKAIPSTIYMGIDDSIIRGVVAEIIYRLDAEITSKSTIKYSYIIPDKSSIIFLSSEMVSNASTQLETYSIKGYHLLSFPSSCSGNSDDCDNGGFDMTVSEYKYEVAGDASVELYSCTESTTDPEKQTIKFSDLHQLIISKQIIVCTQNGEVPRLFTITDNENSKIISLEQVWV